MYSLHTEDKQRNTFAAVTTFLIIIGIFFSLLLWKITVSKAPSEEIITVIDGSTGGEIQPGESQSMPFVSEEEPAEVAIHGREGEAIMLQTNNSTNSTSNELQKALGTLEGINGSLNTN